jgi:hypothetical protein
MLAAMTTNSAAKPTVLSVKKYKERVGRYFTERNLLVIG